MTASKPAKRLAIEDPLVLEEIARTFRIARERRLAAEAAKAEEERTA